jgi:hypothetical protein
MGGGMFRLVLLRKSAALNKTQQKILYVQNPMPDNDENLLTDFIRHRPPKCPYEHYKKRDAYNDFIRQGPRASTPTIRSGSYRADVQF